MVATLWVDKHRPLTLEKLDYHKTLNDQLKALASAGDLPHLLVYGPSGSGKKTRIMAVLRQVFGAGVEKIKTEVKIFTTPSGVKKEIHIVSSNYHIELTPSDVGIYDRVIVQDLLKDIGQTQQVDQSAKRSFKVVIINEADTLSRDAQAGLRRTMEKYMTNLRIILCCNSTSKIISPIRSRCLLVRVPAPSVAEIATGLQRVAHKEKIQLPEDFARRVAEESNGNMRRAALMLEAAKVQQYPFQENQEVVVPDWEEFIAGVARSILQEQTPAQLLSIRGHFYELLTHMIPADTIIRTLAFMLIKNVSDDMKGKIVELAAQFEHQIRLGSKPIIHLEAFVARFMAVYKRWLLELQNC
ncbi:hypothetical protein SeMB42_g01770 [Synchytrium endobioticum]|uniref:Replication factor C subunit 5 n=1 Tax=Synchytrium endobioticum TaxID=286115 RepID=A0A507DKY7_9FUNG|nr:hypothetical protein SeLEV6574_g02203 [Synchytrium endobioticum]TPX51915.1 hypothetical protein SeMB42_g01770 [Synchytrium endobioticum]